jgi:hypothetical protein
MSPLGGLDQAQAEAAAQVLEGLHDIVVPEAVAWTPQTVGWYVLLAVVLAIAARVVVVRRRRHIANRYRREALDVLAVIESDVGTPELRTGALARLPALLKRVALSVVSRAEAASLTGEKWLTFLDAGYGGDGFTRGAGRLLPTLAYGSADDLEAISDQQVSDLVDLTRLWIRSHDLADPARLDRTRRVRTGLEGSGRDQVQEDGN